MPIKKKTNPKLAALTAAAVVLPGMIPKSVEAQAPPEYPKFSYRFTEYTEQDQPGKLTNNGESINRYDIVVSQAKFEAPLGSNFSVSAEIANETMSGASPWYVLEGADGSPVQVMSGATIDEKRQDLSLAFGLYREKARYGLGFSQSTENDYNSNGNSLTYTQWLNNNNTTIDLGTSFSNDEVSPTQDTSIDPTRPVSETKKSNSFSAGFTQVITKNTTFGANYSYAVYRGYLSDPYKLVSVNGITQRDSRPDNKSQIALDFKLRQFVPWVKAAAHIDFRSYRNSWGVQSRTYNLAWYQNISDWQASVHWRRYDQKEASFYEHYFTTTRSDGFYSSDYRLSSYASTSTKLSVARLFEFGQFKLSYENYESGRGDDSGQYLNPGLVNFSVISAGFEFKL